MNSAVDPNLIAWWLTEDVGRMWKSDGVLGMDGLRRHQRKGSECFVMRYEVKISE